MTFKALPEEHGTSRGYIQHIRAGTLACPPCLDAHRLAGWATRIRRGRTKGLTIPLDVLADVLDGNADALARFLGPEVSAAVTERVSARKRVA